MQNEQLASKVNAIFKYAANFHGVATPLTNQNICRMSHLSIMNERFIIWVKELSSPLKSSATFLKDNALQEVEEALYLANLH